MTDLIQLAHAVARQTMAYPFKVWGFGEGIALEALWHAADVLDTPEFRAFVLGLLDRWLAREPQLVEADHSAPGGLLAEAAIATGDARLLALARRLADYMHALPADPTGARYHRPTHADYRDYLYVDCMEVDAPFLCALARTTGDASLYDRAAGQIVGYCSLLQDTQSGLFYHQFNRETRAVNGSFWGRGNGWALLGLLKTLLLLPAEHRACNDIHARFRLLAEALAGHQLPTGDWATVIDRPDTYREASLPAMFGYGLDKGVDAGLLDARFRRVADRAWEAMLARLTAGGLLEGVSVATPPGDAADYDAIATGAGFPWGQGPVLSWLLHRLESRG